MNRHISILLRSFCLAISAIMTVLVPSTLAQPSGLLDVPGSKLYRIFRDPLPNRYWILNLGSGLVLLTETSPGSWSTDVFPIGDVRDFCGPDSQGNLHCSFGGNPAGIYVFNTSTQSVQRTIPLDRYPRALALSPDETKLYLSAYESPL